MSNKKQSSVQMLWMEIDNLIPYTNEINSQLFRDLLEKYETMHKEEVVKAWSNGYDEDDRATSSPLKYYNETFGGNNEQQ